MIEVINQLIKYQVLGWDVLGCKQQMYMKVTGILLKRNFQDPYFFS